MIEIRIGNKEYQVKEAKTPEERIKGLQKVDNLAEDSGMLFYFEPPQHVDMWMKEVSIPLDIIFINEDQEVLSVQQGKPNDPTLLGEDDVTYVLEVNANSGIIKGDILEFIDDPNVTMKVLSPDGSSQMDLEGGERIVSRRETKILIKKAKKALDSHSDKDYKALGKYMFKVLSGQDTRDPEYVDSPK